MNSPADSHEMTILESKGILIHDQIVHAVLTDRRIILTRYSDNKLSIGSIYLADIQKIEEDSDDSGDPLIIVVTSSATGEIKKVVFHFSQKNFPDPHQVSSLWASEINVLKQPTIPFSPGDIPKKDPSTPVLCGTCGNTVAAGSVFCNLCGTKIISPVQQNLPEQREERVQDESIAPEISTGNREPAPEKISLSDADDSDTGENVTVVEPLHKEHAKKESFFTRSGPRQPAIIAISAVVGILVLIAVFFMFVPSVSPGFNLTSPGINSIIPEVTGTASAVHPLVTATTISETISPAVTTIIQTTTRTSATAEPTPIPEVSSAQPTLTSAPGDPATVLVSYTSLFNTGNGSGLYALLSENMKSNYPTDILNNELATARSNGYRIEKIQVNDKIMEGNNAILIVDISWNIDGSPITSMQNVPLVYENDQWKLDTLI
jgi:hypothetical protein